MDRDPIERILERLERPVAPSAEFANSLLSRLVKELEGERGSEFSGIGSAGWPSRRRFWHWQSS